MNHVFHDSRSFYRIFPSRWQYFWSRRHKPHPLPRERPSFATLAQWPVQSLPFLVRNSPVARKYLSLLQPIDWAAFPDRTPHQIWPGPRPASPVPYLIALLIKLDQRHRSLQQLTEFLIAHPELVWLAGFPLVHCLDSPWGFHVAASVPTATQFSRILRRVPNDRLQFLLDETVWAIQSALPSDTPFGTVVSLDTKHILAWTRRNNPKAYIKEGRFDKTQQPKGDPDCRLGCKRRKNQRKQQEFADTTPANEGKPASSIGIGIGEFYWGYASGVPCCTRSKRPFLVPSTNAVGRTGAAKQRLLPVSVPASATSLTATATNTRKSMTSALLSNVFSAWRSIWALNGPSCVLKLLSPTRTR